MDTLLWSQHQSSHQKATPWSWIGCWIAKFDSAWPILLQSHTAHGPLKQFVVASVPPAIAWAWAYFGSLVEMLEWMFSVTWMPCDVAQFRNAWGSGNSAGFHSHPSHWFGDFQSVSTDSVSSDTPLALNSGSNWFSYSSVEYG